MVSIFIALMLSEPGIGQDEWRWKLEVSDLYSSQVGLYKGMEKVSTYQLECDLSDATGVFTEDNPATINLVSLSNFPDGLFIVTCGIGAHSAMISIFDPNLDTTEPIFTETGSYYVEWEIHDKVLKISYDRPCESDATACDGFKRIERLWPSKSR